MRKAWIAFILSAVFFMDFPVIAQSSMQQPDSVAIKTEFGAPQYFSVPTVLSKDQKPLPVAGLPFGSSTRTLTRQAQTAWNDSPLGRYRNPGINYVTLAQTVKPVLSGGLIYVQTQGARFVGEGVFPVRQNAVAMHHENNYISVYSTDAAVVLDREKFKDDVTFSAQDALWVFLDPDSGADQYYEIRICDIDKKGWVNPEIFLPFKVDTRSPKLKSLAVLEPDFVDKEGQTSQDDTSVTPLAPAGSQKPNASIGAKTHQSETAYPQGTYLLAIEAFDVSSKGEQTSGLYRFRLMVDGQVVFDKRLDMAPMLPEGLSFLDGDVPSGKTVSGVDGFVIGSYAFPSGIHALDLSVYDYAGNSARLTKEVRFW